MPVILRAEDYDRWLDPQWHERESLLPVLASYPSDEMKVAAVGTHVNSVRNDDASCIKPERGCA